MPDLFKVAVPYGKAAFMVLNDGTTYTDLDGCRIVLLDAVDEDPTDEAVAAAFRDASSVVLAFGEDCE